MSMTTNRLTVIGAACRDPRLTGLKCAYTGRELDVRLTVSPRAGVSYYAVNCDDPHWRVFPTLVGLMGALSQRDGVTGAVEGEASLVCPYTGSRLGIVKCHDGGFKIKGGWTPRLPQPGPVAFARFARMRGGVDPLGEAEPRPVRVEVTTVDEDSEARELPPELSVAAQEEAERIIRGVQEDTGTVPVVVTVPDGTPAKKSRQSKKTTDKKGA